MPGWFSRTARSRRARVATRAVQGSGGVGLAVDLAENRVEDEVVELFLAADVAVQRAGNHAEAGGEGAHAEGLRAVGGDDREGLGDDTLSGERAAAALPVVGRVEPQRGRVRVCCC